MGSPLAVTVLLPAFARHLLSPQHVSECSPGSPTRSTAWLFTKTSGEPLVDGPTVTCLHAAHECPSSGHLASSPTRPTCMAHLSPRRGGFRGRPSGENLFCNVGVLGGDLGGVHLADHVIHIRHVLFA